jgi:hypothetical protein
MIAAAIALLVGFLMGVGATVLTLLIAVFVSPVDDSDQLEKRERSVVAAHAQRVTETQPAETTYH